MDKVWTIVLNIYISSIKSKKAIQFYISENQHLKNKDNIYIYGQDIDKTL